MSKLESLLEAARKLPPVDRRRLAARLLEEDEARAAARQDDKLEAMRTAVSDELFLADLAAAMEDFQHADEDAQPA